MPRSPDVEPTATVHGDRTSYSHPAFGALEVHKSHGGRNTLFGSDFVHDTTVNIKLRRATEEHSLAHTRHYADMMPLFEVEMSESQWATFVSAFGIGGGVPCTIRSEPGNRDIPNIPYRSQDDHYKDDAKKLVEKPLERLRELRNKIEAGVQGLTKGRASEMVSEIDRAIADLTSSLPYVAESYAEYMEVTREKAKQEIHAYANGVVHDLGLDALAQARAGIEPGRSPIALPDASN